MRRKRGYRRSLFLAKLGKSSSGGGAHMLRATHSAGTSSSKSGVGNGYSTVNLGNLGPIPPGSEFGTLARLLSHDKKARKRVHSMGVKNLNAEGRPSMFFALTSKEEKYWEENNAKLLKVQSVARRFLAIKMKKRLRERNKCAKELLTSETAYIANIDIIITHYLKPLRSKGNKMLNDMEIKAIFSELQVIRAYNQKLHIELTNKLKNWHYSSCIGEVFSKKGFSQYLKIYTQYVNNYERAISTLSQCKKKNTDFRNFLDKTDANPACKGLGLSHYLIVPVQRIPRYVMLLGSILKCTPKDHPDYAGIENSFKDMQLTAEYVNNKKREAEQLAEILVVEEKITGKAVKLAAPHRRFIREGEMNIMTGKKEKMHYWFLFTDLIVETKEIIRRASMRGLWSNSGASNKKYKFVNQINISHETVCEVFQSLSVVIGFRVTNGDTEYIFCCKSDAQRSEWLEAIQGTIDTLKKNKFAKENANHTEGNQQPTTPVGG